MRTKSIDFKSFVSGKYNMSKSNKKILKRNISSIVKGSVTLPIITMSPLNYASAETVDATTKEAVIHAFDPLLELMVDLALPISGVILTSGALLILIGMKDKGFSLILNASLGYCIVQLSPLFISLLAQVGKAL